MEEGKTMVSDIAGSTPQQDDLYSINVAKTRMEDAINSGDLSALDELLDDNLVNFSNTEKNWFGTSGIQAFKDRLIEWHAANQVHLETIIIEIRLVGDVAIEYGWQTIRLESKSGGEVHSHRERYLDVWQRKASGWRLVNRCTNLDVPDTL